MWICWYRYHRSIQFDYDMHTTRRISIRVDLVDNTNLSIGCWNIVSNLLDLLMMIEHTWARMQIWAIWRIYVDLPPIFGPVNKYIEEPLPMEWILMKKSYPQKRKRDVCHYECKDEEEIVSWGSFRWLDAFPLWYSMRRLWIEWIGKKTIQSLTMGLSRWYLLAMKEKVV